MARKASRKPDSKPKHAVPRDEKGRILKGHSLNPGGRTKVPAEMKLRCQALLGEALDVVVGILRDKDEKPELRIRAAEFVWDRGVGKPAQAVNLEDPNSKPAELVLRYVPSYLTKQDGIACPIPADERDAQA